MYTGIAKEICHMMGFRHIHRLVSGPQSHPVEEGPYAGPLVAQEQSKRIQQRA